jgi:hypothetical protein
MSDPINQVEAELSGMQPFPMPGDLADRIESNLQESTDRISRWPDRFLLGAMASGVLAACVLVVVLLVDFSGPDRSAAPARMVMLAPYATPASATPMAFAHGSPDWVDVLK